MTRQRRALGLRAYGVLLRIYSPAFRRRFAADMTRAFAWRLSTARLRGRRQVAVLMAATIADLLRNGIADRLGTLRAWAGAAQDLRVSVRRMLRRPDESLMPIITLAIGIASVTVVASLIQAMWLAPLPFPRSHRAVAVLGSIGGRPSGVSYENARDFARSMRTLQALSPFVAQSVNLTGVPEPDRLRGGFVTSAFFDVVAVRPAMGRPLQPQDDERGAPPAAVLSYETWRARFGASPAVLGRRVMLNNLPFIVVGVMPQGFEFPIDAVEVWLPIWAHTGSLARSAHNLFVVGRLADGQTARSAHAEAAAVTVALQRGHPENRHVAVAIEPLRDVVARDSRAPLGLLLGMVLLMLGAACVNVAGLGVGSMIARRTEILTRFALGGSRRRIAAQMLGESMLVGSAAALVGVALAAAALRLVVATASLDLHGLDAARIDLPMFLVALATGTAAGAAAGIMPALHWSRVSRDTPAASRSRIIGDAARLRAGLVVAQVALAMIVLACAGLLVKSYTRLAGTDPGFEAANLLTLEYRIPRNRYATPASQTAFHDDVLRHVRALPGVDGAASVRALPFSGNGSSVSYRLSERDAASRRAAFNTVSDGYFETMGIGIVRGRALDGRDRLDGQRAVVISESLAGAAWPADDPIGRVLYIDQPAVPAVIVGVARDVRHSELSDRATDAIYAASAQNPGIFMTLAVRISGDPMAFADEVRRAVWQVDADQPVWKIRTLASLVSASLARERFLARVMFLFALATGVLAMLSAYGTVAQAVSERRQEIGLRMALGARPGFVLVLVARRGVTLAFAGVALGTVAALGLSPALSAVLYGVSPSDPLMFGAACVLLLSASLCACWLPARRALRIDPAVALRER